MTTMSKSTDKAYAAIYKALTAGHLRPGERLAEARLAREIGVSRTPVREALRRLSAEGFIEFMPNQGGKVPLLSIDDVTEIFDLRLILESHAAALAAQKIVSAQLTEMRKLCDDMERAFELRRGDYIRAISSSNRRFHRIILDATHGHRLSRILTQVIEIPLMVDTYNRFSADDMDRSMRHHRELTVALTAHDADWARSVMQVHIQSARNVYVRSLRIDPDGAMATRTKGN